MVESTKKPVEERLEQMEEDIRDMRNDVATIKSNTINIDRISTLTNTPAIIKDIMSLIGKSPIKAAVLHLTKEEVSAQDLASQIGQDPSNLAKFTGSFTGKKGYLIEVKKGRNKYFVRGPMLDLINLDDYEPFVKLVESWKSRKTEPAENHPEESTPSGEQTEQKLD